MKKHPEMREHTKRRIIDAFWSLAIEKGVTKVNVSDITKRAGINRGTFYEYFLDVNDLIEFVETEILEDYKPKIFLLQSEYMQTNPRIFLHKMIELITGYDDKFFLLLSTNGDPNFFARIKKEMGNSYARIVHSEKMMEYREYVITLLSSAMLGVLTYWYETGKKISTEELADIIFSFASKGIIGIITEG